ncbi:DUF2953 domain-containing protein [Treponema sp. R6D11]
MIWALGGVGIFILILIFIYYIADFQTNAIYYGDTAKIIVYIYNKKIFSKEFPIAKKVEENKESILNKIKTIKNFFEDNHENIQILSRLAGRTIKVKTYGIMIDIGVGSSVFTGLATGGIHAILSIINHIVDRYIDVEEAPTIRVTPYNTEKKLDICANIIVKCKVNKLVKLMRSGSALFAE